VATFECPVCGFPGFSEPPWRDENASFDICPSCGIQYGYNDARPDSREQVHLAWRTRWLLNQQEPLDPWPTIEELVDKPAAHPRQGPFSAKMQHLEAMLAQDVDEVLRGGEFRQGWLGFLLNELLDSQEDWSRGWSVDGAYVQEYSLLDQSSIDLWGEFHPMARDGYWKSPFRAIFQLNESRDGFADFEIWLGLADSNPGLSYGEPTPRHWPRVKSWRYHIRAD
jgi:hypothetical protein